MDMLENNNQRVIKRMAVHSLRSNKRRSLIMLLAILLSSFMLFSVFTVGITYFNMLRLQNIRLNGAEWDAIMYGVTPEQQKVAENNPDILKTGVVGLCGSILETASDDTINEGFTYADETYWNEMMAPARKWVKGSYPQKYNEVMATEEALKECGLDGLTVGDTFTATYRNGWGEKRTEEFTISGMWDGYGTKRTFYVSKDFFEQSGYELSDIACARYFMDFKQYVITQEEQDAFIDSMNLGKQQRLLFTGEFAYAIPIYLGMGGLVLITCLCAYLLIYNILYLSVSGNIRYYGLLQTVGMTGRQIYRLMKRQVFLLGSAGMAGGLLLGCGVSFFLIPSIVKVLGAEKAQTEVVFHPAVFLLTILITGFTVYISSRKPAKMAVSISPIEALGYRPADGKKKVRKTGKGRIVWRIAKEQLLKDKKKSAVIMTSLAVALSVFLCMTTLIESQGARTMVSNFVGMDLVIQNDTLKKENQQEWKQILTPELLSQIEKKETVKEIHPLWSAQIMVPWEPEFSDVWMREFYDMWMTIPYEDELQEYKEHPENFGSFLVGVDDKDFDYLNETLETPVNKKDFINGKTCILYRNSLEFKDKDLKGKKVTCAEYGNAENTRSFEIAGLTDEGYYSGILLGYPPIIIVSDKVVKDFVPEPFVSKVSIRYQKEYDEKTEQEILSLMQNSPDADDFSYESKIEELEYVEKSQGNMMQIGIGIALILALIGIMNYVNTVIGNIQNRKVELAVLESIGMTEKQMNKMILLEGIFYAAGSLILTGTLGAGVTYLIFQSMNYRGIPFSVPVIPIVFMVAAVFAVCTVIPLITRKELTKKESIVERIKGFE